MDGSPQGSSVHEILQARILEWVAMPFSRGCSRPRHQTQVSVTKSCPSLCNPVDCSTPSFPVLHYLLEFIQTHVHRVGDSHPTISYSVIPFSSCLQCFPASGSFPMSQFFTSGDQSIGTSASVISPSNEYSGLISFRIDWFELRTLLGTLKTIF